MFLRWRHRKTEWTHVLKGYVFKGTDKPFTHTKQTESWQVAVVESYRVNGKPRTRVIKHLATLYVTDTSYRHGGSRQGGSVPFEPGHYIAREIMDRVRSLDIQSELKERFLREIEARGMGTFDWPKTLAPMTPDERAEQEAKALAESKADWAQIRDLMKGAPR